MADKFRLRVEATHVINIETGAFEPTPVVEHDQLYTTFDRLRDALDEALDSDASGGIRHSLDRVTIERVEG